MPSEDTHSPFELAIEVVPGDIDRMGHVNNMVYLKWVQAAAVAHWNQAASEQEQRSLLWVIKRHEIDYIRPAYAGDGVIARTWVGKASRRSFERHTEIRRHSDGKLLAKALTFWCPVDAHSKLPIDVGAEIYSRFSTEFHLGD